MSEQERNAERAEGMQDEAGSTTEEETPDVEAHRFETGRADAGRADAGRADMGRADMGSEPEDRHRNESV
jgi:hypothetical protein